MYFICNKIYGQSWATKMYFLPLVSLIATHCNAVALLLKVKHHLKVFELHVAGYPGLKVIKLFLLN